MKFELEVPLLGEAFLRLFYPSLCAVCSRLLELEEKRLCIECFNRLHPLRLEPSEERIRVTLPATEEGWSLFRYDGLVKELFHKIKFEGRRDLLRVFYPELTQFLTRRTPLASYDWILPIPLDSRRRLEREFNQSGLVAKRIHKFLRGPKLLAWALIRWPSVLPQSLLGREARRINIRRAFHLLRDRAVRGRSVLLVDDIFTTGATLGEVSSLLKSAGAARVGFLTLARTFAH